MEKPPKVIVVVPALDIGGTERHLLAVLPRLHEYGIEVELFVLDGYGVLIPDMVAAGVPVQCPPRAQNLLSRMGRLRQYLRRQQDAMVHFFLPKAYLLGSLCAPRDQIRIMSRRSLNNYHARHPWAARAERWCHRRLRAGLCNSQAIADQLVGEGLARDRVELIYNGIETRTPTTQSDRTQARAALDITPQEVVILNVANLIPYKGHDVIIDAIAELEGRLSREWKVLFVGEDRGIQAQLEQRVANHQLQHRVRWCGRVSVTDDYFRAADIAVVGSREEGLSTFLLEAMAAGLGTVATAVGGNGEALRDRREGLLIQPDSPQALADALEHMVNEDTVRLNYGRAARKRIIEGFSPRACVEAYAGVYQALWRNSRTLG